MNRPKHPRRALLAVPFLLGIAACSGAAADTTAAKSVAGGTTAGTTDDFKDAMQPYTSLMSEASSEMGAGGDAASDFKIAVAVSHTGKAADLFGQLHHIATGLPGADSAGGVAAIKAYSVCEAANREATGALKALDTDAIESATHHMGDCSAASKVAADIFSG